MVESSKWRQHLFEEQQNQAIDKINKQKAFTIANLELAKQKEQARQHSKQLSKLERLNFFPFTHGDLIERNKNVLNELQQQEIVKAIIEKKKQRDLERKK
jgi:hypothetical protein